MLEVEDDGLRLGASSSNSGKVDVAMVEQLADMLQQQGVLQALAIIFNLEHMASRSSISFLR